MSKEIERKYLVTDNSYKEAAIKTLYRQGYLSSSRDRVVRVRVTDNSAYITVKGPNSGCTRSEYEYEIPYEDGVDLIDNLCEKPMIVKYRYKLKHQGFIWEIDEFLGENKGLIIAEIELKEDKQDFPMPRWVGKEVTDDARYYNSNLIKKPYIMW